MSIAIIGRAWWAAILAGSILIATAPGHAEEDASPALVWWSQNENLTALDHAFGRLITALYNTALLPTRKVATTKDTPTAIQAYADAGVPFENWIDRFDNVACDLNKHVCSRPRIPVDLDATSLTDRIGPWAPTNPAESKWRIAPGTMLVVPDLDYEPYSRLGLFSWRESDSLASIHDHAAGGCAPLALALRDAGVRIGEWIHEDISLKKAGKRHQFSLAPEVEARVCGDIVNRLNPWMSSDFDATRAWDTPRNMAMSGSADPRFVAMPALALQIRLSDYESARSSFASIDTLEMKAGTDEDKKIDAAWQNKAYRETQAFAVGQLETALGYHVSLIGPQTRTGQADQGGMTPAISFSSDPVLPNDQGFVPMQQGIFALIGHPFAEGAELPGRIQRIVRIALLDTGFVPDHCEFNPAAQACIVMNANGRVPIEKHGHAVASVIAARRHNGGMVGIDPFAEVRQYDVNLFDTPAAVAAAAAQQTSVALLDNADVVVLAGGYSASSSDDLSESIRFMNRPIARGGRNAVFVASAGNLRPAAADDEDNCLYRPGCMANELDNVVTVAGLEALVDHNSGQITTRPWRDPDLTSRYRPFFTTAEIAKPMLVAVPADGAVSGPGATNYYRARGVSFAVPVTAAKIALLLERLSERPRPRHVKARVVGCGRYFFDYRDVALSVLPDTKCMIFPQFDEVWIDGDGSPGPEVVRGRIVAFWGAPNAVGGEPVNRKGIHFRGWKEDQLNEVVDFDSLVQFENTNINGAQGFVVYRWKNDGKVERIEGADRLSKSIVVEMNQMDGKLRCIEVTSIRRLVPALPDFRGQRVSSDGAVHPPKCRERAKQMASQ